MVMMLDYLREHHGIFARTIYNDLHGYIRHQQIHRDAYIQLGHGLFSKAEEVFSYGDEEIRR